ncbi:MAG TPA: hypothetical protein DD490_23550 [Acidobacteria bacterium]|nr:hypothetical protein [Acidobacteriota bacterium]
MTTAVYLFLIAVAAAALVFALAPLGKAYWMNRGKRLVTCPETNEPVAVEVDPVDAAFHSFLKTREVHLQSCSRWPEKAGCGQECLAQIEASPNGCLVRSVLAEWCTGKDCAVCGRGISFEVGQHKPALMSPDRVTKEWADLRVEDLPETLATHRPVCWDCHIVETLYRLHPDLITERAAHKAHWA